MMHNFLIARLTAYLRNSTQIQLGSVLLQHNAFFLLFNSFTSGTLSESETSRNHHKGVTFTVSYLINSCGLSPEMAVEVSKKVNLKNPDGPNAVLDLLKNYGFSKTQVAKLVEKRPLVLVANADTTLLPKLKFFHSIGVSNTDLPTILIRNGVLLERSLESCLVPRCKALKSVFCHDKGVVSALKHGPLSFTYCDFTNDLVLNINVLRQLSVPQASIYILVSNFPGVAYMKHSKFVEFVKKAKEMGFDPLKTLFVVAVQVLAKMNKGMWESRLEVFERWGWSSDVSLLAFKKFPQCMMISEMKIMKSMSFLVKDMGWAPEDIARNPSVLTFSLERRIIPRSVVVQILKSKGLVKNDLKLGSFILLSEKLFLERYVTRHQEDVPLLLDIYKGQRDPLDAL